MSTTTTQSREEIATEAYLRIFGAHPNATVEERAWGLKASIEDAMLAILHALYPSEYPAHDGERIYKLRADERLKEATDALDELEQDGKYPEEIMAAIIPVLDAALDSVLVAEAARVGVDVEVERHDPYFLGEILHEIGQLPEDERKFAILAVNDGSRVEHRDCYRFPVGTRIRLKHNVSRYPHFICPAGSLGTVEESTVDVIAVKMDEPLEGAEEWDNQIHWHPANGDLMALDAYAVLPFNSPLPDKGNPARFIVSTCHSGSDWCVRPATAREMADPEDEKLTLAAALKFAAEIAAEHKTRWFDFSQEA